MRFKIDLASLISGRNLPFLLCFTLYLRAISIYIYIYLEGRFNGGVFCITSLGGLYLEGSRSLKRFTLSEQGLSNLYDI